MNSNKACCWILTILVGGFVVTMLLIGWGISRALSSGFSADLASTVAIKPNTWLVFNISGSISDYSPEPDLGPFGGGHGSSLNDMLRSIKLAENDPDISGIILRPSGSLGMANLRELRVALLEFRKTDKPIYAHLDVASDRDYYLASVADKIYLMPGRMSGINFGGLAYSNTYVKGTFEKLGIKFHVLHAGRYKGAYEDFARDSMSTDLRESLTTLYQDVYNTYVRETAEARAGLNFEALNREFMQGDQLIVNSATCVERGYVDAVEDWPVLRKRLQGESEEFESLSPRAYLSAKHLTDIEPKQNEIAVLYAEGAISFGDEDDIWSDDGISPKKLNKQLEKLAEDEEVKAVVLRVSSPGGSALASKQILEAARRLNEQKPLIVSMGPVAASGGYYISLAADKIVAQPNTVTGSIGVVTMFPSAEELYNKIGAREETISIGRWANFFRIDKTMGPEQEAVLRNLMDTVYTEFREDVTIGRGLQPLALDTVAEGRVWTGNQALARGLVDTLGGLELAVRIAAREAALGADEYRVEYYPEKQDVFSFVIEHFATQVSLFEKAGTQLAALQDPETIINYVKRFYDRLEFLQTVLPVHIEK